MGIRDHHTVPNFTRGCKVVFNQIWLFVACTLLEFYYLMHYIKGKSLQYLFDDFRPKLRSVVLFISRLVPMNPMNKNVAETGFEPVTSRS